MSKDHVPDKYRHITEDKLYPLLWRMAIPSMIGMMVSAVYSMTDTFFIGRLGLTDLTASVGIVFAFISVVQAVGFWFGYGAGNYVSRQIGKQRTDEADKMTSIGVGLAVLTGTLVMILGLMFLRPLALLLGAGTSEGLMNATVSYLRITLFSVPVMLTANVLYNVLRLQGAAKESMTGLLAGMLVNMALDPVFILLLNMGVEGAALASFAGQLCGTVILITRTGKNGNTSVHLSQAKPQLSYVKEILAGGAPNFCRQGISSISAVILNNIAGCYGEAAIAGMTISSRIVQTGYALVIGFGQGFQPICAINFGAGRYDRIKTSFKYALATSTIFLIIMTVIFMFGADGLVGIFSKEAAVILTGTDMLKAQCVSLPFMAYYILTGMCLQNIGRFAAATGVTTAQNGTFLIPAAIIFSIVFGYFGLVWCRPFADLCALVFSYIFGGRISRKILKER
ncbi:MAG: MATE family efflux transporter [Lachnospiraceae bacterium]|nr:MATE family efflux transporter [Lachnospiraceae bacterium]